MKFYEQDLQFIPAEQLRFTGDPDTDLELLGIRVRLGNRPLVSKLNNYISSGKKHISNKLYELDVYAVTHAIGAIRLTGRATVEELQYHAVMDLPNQLRTIDLIPSTRFREVINANIEVEGVIHANGNTEVELPNDLLQSLTEEYLTLGGDLKIQLSSKASFLGKFSYSLTYPVHQSTGIATNTCSWVLKPDAHKNELLGDQLMVQFLAVPKGTEAIEMEVHGVVKADRGIFFRQQELSTERITVRIELV